MCISIVFLGCLKRLVFTRALELFGISTNLVCHPLDRLESEVLSNIELVQLEDDLKLFIKACCHLGHMGHGVVLDKAPEELQEDQYLSVHPELAYDL